MAILSRWFAPVILAAGIGIAGLSPAAAQAQNNDLTRIIVDIADVMFRSGQPYYRHGDYGHDDRLIVSRDRYGRPVYYRNAPRQVVHRQGPPYGNAYGYHRNRQDNRYQDNRYQDNRYQDSRRVKCKKNGRCEVTYYDPRYDRDQYSRHDRDNRRRRGRGRDD